MSKELRELRLSRNIPAKEMVAVVQSIYPKYDKTIQSKCENGDVYGIVLKEDAMKALCTAFAPELLNSSKRAKKERHRLTSRISARLPDAEYQVLQQYIRADGYDTMQDWLTSVVKNYIVKRRKLMFPDDPAIANTERTGYPNNPTYPCCPVCGAECDTVFRNTEGEYVGCNECLNTKDAWEVDDCFPGKE